MPAAGEHCMELIVAGAEWVIPGTLLRPRSESREGESGVLPGILRFRNCTHRQEQRGTSAVHCIWRHQKPRATASLPINTVDNPSLHFSWRGSANPTHFLRLREATLVWGCSGVFLLHRVSAVVACSRVVVCMWERAFCLLALSGKAPS
jgi:hypothetical protein